MFDKILKEAKDKIKERKYIMSVHAEEEMSDDFLSIYDVEHTVLTGKITERQKDKVTGEWKYRIVGHTIGAGDAEIIVKFGQTGKLVIITVYAL